MNNNKQVSKPRFIGLPKPLATMVIGIFLFLVFTLPVKFMSIDKAPGVLLISRLLLESSGMLIVSEISILTNTNISDTVFNVATPLISILPIAVIGFMIGSNKKSTNIKGIISLTIYICITILAGLLVIYLAD